MEIIVIAVCLFMIGLVVAMDKMYTSLYAENKKLRNKLYYEMIEHDARKNEGIVIDSVAREL